MMRKLASYMGKDIEKMSRDELVTALENTASAMERQRRDYCRQLDNLLSEQKKRSWVDVLLGI